MATLGTTTKDDIVSEIEIDLTTLVRKDSTGNNSPRLFKVIAKDNEGQFPVEEGWQLMEKDNRLLSDHRFRDQFLYNPEMVHDFNNGSLTFMEGKISIYLTFILCLKSTSITRN